MPGGQPQAEQVPVNQPAATPVDYNAGKPGPQYDTPYTEPMNYADKMAGGAGGGSRPMPASAQSFYDPQMSGAQPEMMPSGEQMGMKEFTTGVAPRSATPPADARKALEYWQQELDSPENRDKGAGGLIKEIIQNYLYGMSQAAPGSNVRQTLATGAAGGGLGFLNKGWNERRRAEQELPRAQQRVDFENQQAQRQSTIANTENQITNRNRQTALEMDESIQKKITATQKQYLDQWNDLDEFDPKDPKYAAFAEQARKSGVTLIPKVKGERYSTQIAPDGRVVVTNTSTGDYKIGNETLAKPATFKEDEIADVEFGLYDDKQIENMAEAGLTEGLKTRTVRPEVLPNLPAEFKNEDGTFNEAAFFEAKANGDTELSITDIYAEIPSDAKQRKAAKVEQLRKSQGGLRKQVTRFRSALNHRTPNPNAEPMTLDEVKQTFQQVLKNGKPKDLEEFFSILKHANIR